MPRCDNAAIFRGCFRGDYGLRPIRLGAVSDSDGDDRSRFRFGLFSARLVEIDHQIDFCPCLVLISRSRPPRLVHVDQQTSDRAG
jgi:hypothetical protein